MKLCVKYAWLCVSKVATRLQLSSWHAVSLFLGITELLVTVLLFWSLDNQFRYEWHVCSSSTFVDSCSACFDGFVAVTNPSNVNSSHAQLCIEEDTWTSSTASQLLQASEMNLWCCCFRPALELGLKVKGRDIYIPPLKGKPRPAAVSNAKWRTDTGDTAQVAAAHCPNERTLDPAVCSQTDPTMPQSAAFTRCKVLKTSTFKICQDEAVMESMWFNGQFGILTLDWLDRI